MSINVGRTDAHNEVRSGRPSVITKNLNNRVDAHVRENWQGTTDKPHGVLQFHSSTLIQKFVANEFQECSQNKTCRNTWVLLCSSWDSTQRGR
jgi:hypothetical protein